MDEHQKLVALASSGDTPGMEALVARHLPNLHAYVRLQLGARLRAYEASGDVVQSVCREVLEDLPAFEFRGEPAFRAWLFTEALRKIRSRAAYWNAERRDHEREAPREDDASAELLDPYRSLCSPSQGAIARETMETLERVFQSLPEDHREVILLSRIVGLSRAEIAVRMGRTEAAIRNLLPRALARLAGQLDDASPSA